MKDYDLAFSMGFSCGGTMALRKVGMQFASYPLDWIGAPGVVKTAKMVESGFANWLEREDLELVDVRAGSFDMHVYRNRRTGFGFPHDFSSFYRLDEIFGRIREKYLRRITRFDAHLRAAKKVFVCYIERPIDPPASDADLIEARRILSAKYPGAEFDLVYFWQENGREGFAERTVGEGIVSVACDYRRMDHGEVSHAISYGVPAEWFRRNIRVADRRTEEEKRRFAAEGGGGDNRKKRFTEGGPLRRWLDKQEYNLYRRITRRLQERGILPREFPLWFY